MKNRTIRGTSVTTYDPVDRIGGRDVVAVLEDVEPPRVVAYVQHLADDAKLGRVRDSASRVMADAVLAHLRGKGGRWVAGGWRTHAQYGLSFFVGQPETPRQIGERIADAGALISAERKGVVDAVASAIREERGPFLSKAEAKAALEAIGQMTDGNARDFGEWRSSTHKTYAEWQALLRAEEKIRSLCEGGSR